MKKESSFLKAIAIPLIAILPITAICQCVTPFEAGSWTNIDAATGGITHVRVNFSCNDQVLCGVDANGNVTCSTPGPPYQVHLFGNCSPSDCDWGTVNGSDYVGSDGTHWVYAFFDQGFAKRYVYIKRSVLFPGDLFMWMYTDFVDPHRSDYILRNWFHH